MKTKYIGINESIDLAYFENIYENSKFCVVLIHGLAEHKGRYDYFFEKLRTRNISFFAIDLRGHGESRGERGYINDFYTFLSDLNIFISYIKEKYPHLKIALLGHSLGGLIATGYIQKYGAVDFLVLSNPLLYAPNLQRLFHFIPYKMFGKFRIKKRHSESLEMLKYSYNDPLASNYFTLRLLGAIFEQGITFVSERFDIVETPVLLLGGDMDPLINTNKLEYILSKFGSFNKRLIIYKGVKHRLLQSDKKDDVIFDIIEWVNTQIV